MILDSVDYVVTGNYHDATKTVTYLINDLEISLQLGQFEFGAAKPIDNRSAAFPFSQLSMHEKALIEYRTTSSRRQRPGSSVQSANSSIIRPQSAFHVEKPRVESRLCQALVLRPKTAPTTLHRSSTALRSRSTNLKRPESPLHTTAAAFIGTGLGDEFNHSHIPEIHEPDSELSSVDSSPRTYRSYSREMQGDSSRMSEYGQRESVLTKYFPNHDKRTPSGSSMRTSKPPNTRASSAPVKAHKCHEIGPHTIHEKLNTTTLGPSSTVISVVGYARPSRNVEPVHKAAWYHFPNHYTTSQKPYINARVYSERKKRLTRQRSQSFPVKSRYLQDHTNAIKLIAQHDSAFMSA